MTAVLERAPAAETTRSRTGAPLPWLIVAGAAALALHSTGTPDRQIAVYGGYFVLAVTLPGTLVYRMLFGSRGNLPEDAGLGSATGLVVQLAGWAVAAATGTQEFLVGWPVLVVLPFLAVPALRRHWRIRDPRPMPAGAAWALAGVLLLVVGWATTVFRDWPLPAATASYYPDLFYHLALVHEMTRSMPFQVPQVAGEMLRYHYLSDADMAAGSMVTGIPEATVQLRLWVLPIVATGAIATAALARTVTGRWWAAPLAAGVTFAGQAPVFGAPYAPTGSGLPISLLSPSQTYVLPLAVLLMLIAVETLRGRSPGWGWAFLPVLAVACAGSKSSALPPFAAGVVLAGVVTAARQRRVPWAAAGLLATALFGMVVGLKLFAGGGAGTLGVQPLSVLRWMTPYAQTVGAHDGVARGGLFPPGLTRTGAGGLAFVAGLVVWWVLVQAPRLIGLVRLRRSADDPVSWLLGGTVLAGTGAMWFFWHPSQSQAYFFACVVPFATVLTVSALADRVERRPAPPATPPAAAHTPSDLPDRVERRPAPPATPPAAARILSDLAHRVRRCPAPVAAAVAGGLWALAAPRIAAPARPRVVAWAEVLAGPVLETGAVALLVLAAAFAIGRRRRWHGRPAAALTATLAATLGATLAAGTAIIVRDLTAPPAGPPPTRTAVTAAEMRAALWLDGHAGPDDVLATNVHCMPMDATLCNARAFWVAGLAGRRTLVESWAYTDAAVSANGVHGLKYFYQPAPDPAVYELNQRVFALGDPADVERLRDGYGVRWLLADTRAGSVAPGLAQVATVRFTAGPATVYELTPGGRPGAPR